MWKGLRYECTLNSARVERPGEENGVGDAPEVALGRGRDVVRVEKPCPARLSHATRAAVLQTSDQSCIRYS